MNKIKAIIKPVAEELGKFGETAKKQIAQIEDKDSKQQTEEVVKHLYGVDKQSNEKPATTASNAAVAEIQRQEEAQKQKLRQELHQQYVQNTFNPPKPQEETPVERVEKQKMEDIREKDEKEKKKKPIMVQRAQQSVEKFRGAAG